MIDSRLQGLWDSYLAAERDCIRTVMIPALDRFLDALLESPPEIWKPWAKKIAADISDRAAATPMRFPLFRRAVLPALAEGVLRQEPGCARWLASFESLLFHSPEPLLPPELRTSVGLLAEAVRIDPADDAARRRLIDRHASYLEYTLHELPIGVLFGIDGATPNQCQDLLNLLGEFKADVALTSQEARFSELIRDCEFHYNAYAAYIRSGPPYDGYERYLQRVGRSPEN
jgi:hypothetical protein